MTDVGGTCGADGSALPERQQAGARAKARREWWKALTPDQQAAVKAARAAKREANRRENESVARRTAARARRNAELAGAAARRLARDHASTKLAETVEAPRASKALSRRHRGKDGLTAIERARQRRLADNDANWAKRHPAAAKGQRALRKQQAERAERWKHKNNGTPETHEHHRLVAHHRFALVRMEERGEITADQHACATEIAMVAEGIEADVNVRAASYEMRVDNASSGRDRIVEGVVRVRRHIAYTHWRAQLHSPKRLVLDMIVGDQISYNAAARLYRVGWRKARRLLIEALDRWPGSLEFAARRVDANDVAAIKADLYE